MTTLFFARLAFLVALLGVAALLAGLALAETRKDGKERK